MDLSDGTSSATDTSLDDLASSLAGSFSVSSDPNNPNSPHPRFSQYKMKYSSLDQEERRRKMLLQQKSKRQDAVNRGRDLSGLAEDDDEERPEENMDVTTPKPKFTYKNYLMLSEWMLDVPEDFASDWIMVPCPVGRRSLVVATRGETSVYAKNGYCVKKFSSSLPGGSRQMTKNFNGLVILDTVYCEASATYYVLDVMSWKQMPLCDTDAECRMYWLHSKFQEHPELGETTKKKRHRFVPLPNFICTKDSIEKAMAIETQTEIDGLLFYHKMAHYTHGTTPLVLWLKPYMLPEVLGTQVPSKYFTNIPSQYSGFEKHKATVQQRAAKITSPNKDSNPQLELLSGKKDMDTL